MDWDRQDDPRTKFLVEGVKSRGHGLYVCATERIESYIRNMERLGWPISQLAKSKKLIAVKAGEIHGGRPQSMIEKLLYMIDTANIRRIILDSYTALMSYFKGAWSARLFTQLLLDYLSGKSCTAMLVMEADNNSEPKLGDIGFLCDGVIHLRKTSQLSLLEGSLG